MADMFCFQCQQTAGNKGCVVTGVCGKQPETALLQDELVYELVRLSKAVLNTHRTKEADRLVMDGLFTTLTNVNFDNGAIRKFMDRVNTESFGTPVPTKVNTDIKKGAIKHIFLIGGCDGAHPGRNYYTEFVKQTPIYYKYLFFSYTQ